MVTDHDISVPSKLLVPRIMVVDDEVELMYALSESLEQQGYQVEGFSSSQKACEALQHQVFDILITDLMMPGMDGIALLQRGLEADPYLVVIMMTGQGTVPDAVSAMRNGAFDYVLKPFKLKTLTSVLARAMNFRRLRIENAQLREAMSIYELNQAISYRLDLGAILDAAANIAMRQYQADEFSILLLDESGGELCMAMARGGRMDRQLDRCQSLDSGIAGWVARQREPLVLHDKVEDARYVSLHPRSGIVEAASVPMLAADRLVGVLNLNRVQQRRPFTPGQIEALGVFANTVASAIDAAQLYEKMTRSEARHRQVLENVDEVIYMLDVSADDPFLITSVPFMSPHVEDILGYTASQFVQDPVLWSRLIHPDDLETVRTKTRAIVADRCPVVREYRMCHRSSGEYRYLEDRILPQFDSTGELMNLFGVMRDITERKRTEAQLNYLAYHDSLTGLPNRFLLLKRLKQATVEADRHTRLVAVLFLDLDRFKNINDSLGHEAGDTLLRQVAPRLKASVRPGDAVARHGGDEFTVVLANIASVDDVVHVVKKIMQQFEAPFVIAGREFFVTTSIGITLYPHDDKDPEMLLKNADTALYHAKESGRNAFQFFTTELNRRVEHQLALEMALRQALEHEDFLLYYQPQVDLVSGAMVGVEALIRWQRDEEMVSPLDFIPLAEDTGLIVPIGEWALRTACTQAMVWQAAGLPPVKMSVNLSARQFKEAHLVQTIDRILQDTGLDPRWLVLEITESAIMHHAASAQKVLQQLDAMGIGLAVDDFGTGYSSLSYLKRFPIGWLKIDKSFVQDVTNQPDDAAIAQAIISLARSLDMKVVAEGVETKAQLAFLLQRGCDTLQGYLYSAPLPADGVMRLLQGNQRLELQDVDETLSQRTLLIVDDEMNIRQALKRALRREGYLILDASGAEAAFELLAQYPVGVILCDQRMETMTGVEFFSRVKNIYPQTVRIVLSGYADLESITGAINRGAVYRYLTKPWEDDVLRQNVRDAFRYYAIGLGESGQAAAGDTTL